LLEKNFSTTTSYEHIFANGKFNSAIYHYDQFMTNSSWSLWTASSTPFA